MDSNNQFETPTIESNYSSNTEFYDAESNDACCVFKSLTEIEVVRTYKDGKEESCCAQCGRSVQELVAREQLKHEGKL